MEYKGKGTAILLVKDVSDLNFNDLSDLDELIEQRIILKIYYKKVDIEFYLLLLLSLKINLIHCTEFDRGLIIELIRRHVLEISEFVFGENPLPEELFSLGKGIYQMDDEMLLLAFNNKSSIFPKGLDVIMCDNRFQIFELQMLNEVLGDVDYFKSEKWLFDNKYPKLNMKVFLDYLDNWLAGQDFNLVDGKVVVSPSF